MSYSDLLGWGMDFLDKKLHNHASVDIVYSQGTENYAIKATHGANEHSVDDLGVLLQSDAADWIISLDPTLNSSLPDNFEPKHGDHVYVLLGTDIYQFEVMSEGNEPVYRRSDTYQNRIRVHTKRIGIIDEILPGGGRVEINAKR